MIRSYTIETVPGALWDECFRNNEPLGPFLTYRWHRLWYDVFGWRERSCILSLHDTCIAPFIRNGATLSFSGGVEITDYLDIIGPHGDKERAWDDIRVWAGNQGITELSLHNVPASSPTVAYFSRQPNDASRISVVQEDTTPKMSLPTSWDAFETSLPRHARHELRRKIRLIESKYPDATIKQSHNPKGDMPTFLELMATDEHKASFLTPAMRTFFLTLPGVFPTELSLQFLQIGNNRVAGILFFILNDTLYLYNSGADSIRYSMAGFYLTAKSIGYAIGKGLQTYNFLQGSERYKYNLGGNDFLVNMIRESF